jgi:hypothetical protein
MAKGGTHWDRVKRERATIDSKRQHAQERDLIRYLKPAKRPKRTHYYTPAQPRVAIIHWVKDTPESLALQFLAWRTSREQR